MEVPLRNNPQWALPSYDDHDWKLLKVSEDWDAQGYHEEQEQAWFRFTLLIPANTPALVLQMPKITKSYQLFANGIKFAQVGNLPPDRGYAISGAERVFTLPLTPSPQPQRLAIALRLWQSSSFQWLERDSFGEVLVGEPNTLLPAFERRKDASHLSNSGMSFTVIIFSIPLMTAAMLLFWMTRKNLYLWFAAEMLIGIAQFSIQLLSAHFAWRSDLTLALLVTSSIAADITNCMFIFGLLEVGASDVRKSRWIAVSILLAVLAELSAQLIAVPVPFVVADSFFFSLTVASQLIRAGLLFQAWRRGATDAGLLLVPFALNSLVGAFLNFGYTLLDTGRSPGILLSIPAYGLLTRPFQVTVVDAVNLLLLFGYLFVMVYRFARISREEQRLSTAL